ncbi:MAG: SAM-dependent methyltransferase [Chloroflexi bacterium]|nr:SAM-dependent methyltransferase [Chloroflexota bacterium]
MQNSSPPKHRQWGDFQTPLPLARRVCQVLDAQGIQPRLLIEPTHGAGNLILAALETFSTLEHVYGVEIQAQYAQQIQTTLAEHFEKTRLSQLQIELARDDFFQHHFPARLTRARDILILGNPPWVTNAELGALDSKNLPFKKNLKALSGLDALTGKSNFDLGEYIILRLLDTFAQADGTLAMLCKTATAKTIVELAPRQALPISQIRLFEFDAKREFGAAVDACLLVLRIGQTESEPQVSVYSLDEPTFVKRRFGWVGDHFVSNVQTYQSSKQLEGKSPFEWRQGVKHDCAAVLELEAVDGELLNGYAEVVQVEADWIYGLVKGSDLEPWQTPAPHRRLVLTQKQIGQETLSLQSTAPALWAYLVQHEKVFSKRKSSIYRQHARFAIFGIGAYSFKLYKVAISGLHKEPTFSLVMPFQNRPVMLDDTCYFLGFDEYADALFTVSLLNTAPVLQFLDSIIFRQAKRPYTKSSLMRLDLARVADPCSFETMQLAWERAGLHLTAPVTLSDWEAYRARLNHSLYISNRQMELALG